MTTKKPTKYKLKLETSGLEYKSEGVSVIEALQNLGLSWNEIKAKGVVTVSKGNKKYSHLFPLPQLRRIFANKLTLMMWGKRLRMLFKAQ